MNCFSHGFRFLDDAYFLVGTAVPDWLAMIDRKVRVRERSATKHLDASDPALQQLASGIVQHHREDALFHTGEEFVSMNLQLALVLRNMLGDDAGFRPHFVAHIVIEMLLDSVVASQIPQSLDRYYHVIGQVDPMAVQQCVNQIASQPTVNLAGFFPKFLQEAYLYDYFEDSGVLYRVNRILRGVGLNPLPEFAVDWIAQARDAVNSSSDLLLAPVLQAPSIQRLSSGTDESHELRTPRA
ncbi:MAG TPA: hypothetical protein PKD64_15940 [Pirellulaceae bacterium]|nr:hypothetical protein [Pirellulaceae bacterium]HMO93679.1 hypothetical protein [Pirellulaceae bacterium]HMP68421.1 hypothetical protein [Pirellulaceae bacterium]